MKVLKLIGGMLAGGAVGFLLATLAIVLFTDMTLLEFFQKCSTVALGEVALTALMSMAAFCLSIPIHVTLHESGHLVAGLLSGYRFVSFRIFNFTFIRLQGRLRVRRYAVAGTGGQCLLCPPDLPDDEVPTVLYNLGGVLANLVTLLAVAPLMWCDGLSPFVHEALAVFLIVGALLMLVNAVPMKVGGICNDGYNALFLHRHPKSCHGLMVQLRANALVQEGVRPKDLPRSLFATDGEPDYKDPFQYAVVNMEAAALMDGGDMEGAHRMLETLHSHRKETMPLLAREVACELLFTSLVTGREEQAHQLYTKELAQYIRQYRNTMSSKERILFAVALFMEHDRPKAEAIYNKLRQRQAGYLMQGEVLSDLAIMEQILGNEALYRKQII